MAGPGLRAKSKVTNLAKMIPRRFFPMQASRVLAVSFGVAAAALFTVPAHAADTDDNTGAGNGNQVEAPIQAPITIECNAVGVLGNAEADCPEKDGKHKVPKPTPSPSASTPPVEATSPAAEAEKPLPRTGSAITPLLLGGAVVVGAGGALLVISRRRAAQR